MPWMLVVAAMAVGASWACGSGAFECQSDAACSDPGAEGICQPDGFCSFPDDGCESGQRYGEHAGSGKQGTCVPLEPDGTTGTSTTSTTSTTATTSTSTTSTTGVDTATDGSSTTSPVSGTSTTEGTSTGSDATTGPPPDCTLDEQFDGPAIDEGVWNPWADFGVMVEQGGGVLQISINVGTGMAGIQSVQLYDLSSTAVTMTVGTPPDPSEPVQQALMVQNMAGSIRITLTQGQVLVTTWDGNQGVDVYSGDHEVTEGDRFRFVFEDEARAEMSVAQGPWELLWSGPAPVDWSSARIVCRAHTDTAVLQSESVSFDAVSVCPL